MEATDACNKSHPDNRDHVADGRKFAGCDCLRNWKLQIDNSQPSIASGRRSSRRRTNLPATRGVRSRVQFHRKPVSMSERPPDNHRNRPARE